jgi:hypothetical protein
VKKIYLLVFSLVTLGCYSQKALDLHYTTVFGKDKSFQFFNHSKIHYKLKGDVFYRTHKLVNMQDSFLVFDNDSVVMLGNIKKIRIDGAMVSPYFFGAGALFFMLDTGHGLLFERPQVISDQALTVTGVAFGLGCIVTYIQNKRIRIKKNSVFRIIDMDYRNLQSNPSTQ